jgi:hypothetical protein
MGYQRQRTISDKYLNSFKDILIRNSMHFLSLEVSDFEKDTQEATDMVIKVVGGDVALRVREPSCKYRDFTIRTRSRYGKETEIDKLRNGFGDWYLYGWGDGHETVLEYILVDLDKVRKFKLLDMPIVAQWGRNRNYDGTEFISIPIGALQMYGCIVTKQLSSQTQQEVDNYISSKLAANY